MGWLAALSSWWQRKALSSYDLYLDQFLANAASKTGIRVTWDVALQASTAISCCRIIGEGIAQIPLKLHRSRPDGGADLVADHPWSTIASAVNPWCTSYEWRETAGLHLALMNRSYALINRAGDARSGLAAELLPLYPQQVRTERADSLATRYWVVLKPGQAEVEVEPERVLHFRGPSWNGWEGLDGIKLAREAIGLALATEEHGARLFKNGAIPGGILSTDQNLDKGQRDALRESWQAAQAGLENAYKTAVLWSGMKYTNRAQFNDQAQWVEVRRLQVAEVCRHYRVFPIMVGEADRTATYASSEQMFLAHVVHTMGPWYKRIEQRLDLQLLTAQERASGLYFKFNVAGLLRGSHRDRAEFYRVMWNIGALNANEIRELEERNPYDGGEEYLRPTNMVPSDTPPSMPSSNEPAPTGAQQP